MNQEQKKKTNPFLIGCLSLFVVFFLIFLAILNIPESVDNEPSGGGKPSVNTTTGVFQDKYAYTVMSDESNRYAATFKPFLPRDDKTLMAAYFKLVEDIYGQSKFQDAKFELVEINGSNVIRMLNAVDGDYYFYPIKEDTGEIHSVILWRE